MWMTVPAHGRNARKTSVRSSHTALFAERARTLVARAAVVSNVRAGRSDQTAGDQGVQARCPTGFGITKSLSSTALF